MSTPEDWYESLEKLIAFRELHIDPFWNGPYVKQTTPKLIHPLEIIDPIDKRNGAW